MEINSTKIPKPHVIEEVEKHRKEKEQRIPAPLHLPLPSYDYPEKKEPEQKGDSVILIQL